MTDLEIMQRAKMYLDRLAQGIDPISGREMPEDTVLNQARLARCFSYVSGILQQVIDNGGTVGPLQRNDFTWTPEMHSRLTPADRPLRIMEFAQRLAAASADPNTKMPRTTLFTDWLLENGYLEKVPDGENKMRRIPTDLGRSIGLYTEARAGKYGEYQAIYYDSRAQQFLLEHLPEIFSK